MSDDEVNEFGTLFKKLRQVLRAELSIDDVYYFYNEDTKKSANEKERVSLSSRLFNHDRRRKRGSSIY